FPNHAFWVGYGIEVMLPGHDTVLCARNVNIQGMIRTGRKGPTLGELITGEPSPHLFASENKTVQQKAQEALADLNSDIKRLYPQSVAFLFRMPSGATNLNAASDIAFSSYSLQFDLENLPLIFVGDAEQEQSLELLERLFGTVHSKDHKTAL